MHKVQGAQIATPADKGVALSISAVLVPTLGIFEGQFHHTHDDLVIRYRDDGSSTLPILGLEGHDEGDMQPNSDTSAWSGSGTLTKITTEEAAKYLGMDVEDITPAACSMEYKAVWNATNVWDSYYNSINTSAAIEHATMDIVMKSIKTVAIIIGLVAIDFI